MSKKLHLNRPAQCVGQWASYQIRKIAGCACAGNAGNVFPATAGKRSRHASRHVRDARAVMHAGIANYRFPLKSVVGENVPGIPGACATRNFTIWKEAHEGVGTYPCPKLDVGLAHLCAWWRHLIETFSALLAICAGEFTSHRWSPRTKASDAQLWCCYLICAWINGLVNNHEAGDLRRHSSHYDVTVMVDERRHWLTLMLTPIINFVNASNVFKTLKPQVFWIYF